VTPTVLREVPEVLTAFGAAFTDAKDNHAAAATTTTAAAANTAILEMLSSIISENTVLVYLNNQ
jgi:hypothetical protein